MYEIAKAIYPRLAATYAEIGDIEKAIETVGRAVELNPDLMDEARGFIESLRNK
ncbi:MAG: hypothetical protein HQ538_02095 [Parcubacteria group bacterium]|nr:hypothetical protein [Parcubacteria group bacterium]